jgi:Raf kinase inhibitor-like YbhB/YbcL family protein
LEGIIMAITGLIRSGGWGIMGALAMSTAVGAPEGATFKLESPGMTAGAKIPNAQVYDGFGCSGRNISPALRWSGAPAGTKSVAVTMYDPDAPTGSGWWHWVVINIPAAVSELPEGAGNASGTMPGNAIQGRTDFGTAGYGGPCPPAGDKPHRYIFTAFALKTERLDVASDASPAMIGFMINANMLAKASFTALYGR